MKKLFIFVFCIVVSLFTTSCERADTSSILSAHVLNYSINICQNNNGLHSIKYYESEYQGRGAEHEYTSSFSARCSDGAVFYARSLSPNSEKEKIEPL